MATPSDSGGSNAGSNGGNGAEFLKIPLNLKNGFRPFVLDPENKLNEIQPDTSKPNGKPQLFSYRKDIKTRLGILPSSWCQNLNSALKNDISLKLLYGMNTSGTIENNSIGLQHLLDHIPMVQIREYQQDSKLNQVFSLFGSIKDGLSAGKAKAAEDAAAEAGGVGSLLSDAVSTLKTNAGKWWETFKWIINNADVFAEHLVEGISISRTVIKNNYKGTNDKAFMSVIKVPHLLYYQMISSLSLNVFELPFSGDFIREANGHGGWNGSRGYNGLDPKGGLPILQKIIGYAGDNIKVNMTPTWDGAQNEEGTNIEFTVNLFNDSVEQTCVNFIFVNTILPAAMFSQYHIFQQSPSLFDVKVDGLGRFFMCSGSFKVEYKGVVRSPSDAVINTLVDKHMNKAYNFTANYLRFSGLVKIPDVYQITLQFKSLLPNSFNNYIFSTCGSEQITVDNSGYQGSLYKPLMESFTKTINVIGSELEKGKQPFKKEEAPPKPKEEKLEVNPPKPKEAKPEVSPPEYSDDDIAAGRASYGR